MLQDAPIHAYIPVKDVARARAFYERTLGLTPGEEIAGGVVYELGDHTSCFMYPTPNAGTSSASQAFWTVDDVEREVSELKKRGVRFEEYDMPGTNTHTGIAEAGGAKAAWFKDPDGNIMALVQSMDHAVDPRRHGTGADTRRATKLTLTPPRVAFVVATRAALAAGVAFLLAGKLPVRARRGVGIGLVALGTATTLPALWMLARAAR